MPKYFTSIKDTDSAALIFTYNGNDGCRYLNVQNTLSPKM